MSLHRAPAYERRRKMADIMREALDEWLVHDANRPDAPVAQGSSSHVNGL